MTRRFVVEGDFPKRIGKYHITGLIGAGGLGRVYAARDPASGSEVAIKILGYGTPALDEAARKRLRTEVRVAAKLTHPNLAKVIKLDETQSIPLIVMELLLGKDLGTLLRTGKPLSLAEKLGIMEQVSRGLAYVHKHQIVHRDIKPGNIFVLANGRVKILDFGLAKVKSTPLNETEMVVGSLAYMSPEQALGKVVDQRSDLWSVGVVLYELLAGHLPFEGGTLREIVRRILHEEPPPVEQSVLGAAGAQLQEIIRRALAKNPADRYASADVMADDLSQASEALETKKERVSLLPGEHASLLEEAATVFLDPAEWLQAPNSQLAGATPADLVAQGDEWRVREVLRAIKHGLIW